jgi:predicted nuclease with RNAse H fold
MPATRIIGLDWATKDPRRGIAIVDVDGNACEVALVRQCSTCEKALDLVLKAMEFDGSILIAIDAPLGWPVPLIEGLAGHFAGNGVAFSMEEMFSRATDRFVRQMTKKLPLEVGANLIARVAHSAVSFLGDLRVASGCEIALVWDPEEMPRCGVIEVYPAVTRLAHRSGTAWQALAVNAHTDGLKADANDALWCAVAGRHFLRGECHAPEDRSIAKREGWIWFPKGARTPHGRGLDAS